MHAKTDSAATSLEDSSPGRPAAYYVQSPSHDDGKNAASFHSSHQSSSTLFSAPVDHHHRPHQANLPSPPEEEGLLDDDDYDDDEHRRLPCRFYVLTFLLAFFLLFSFFSVVLWGVSRNQKPQIEMTSVSFSVLTVQAGMDATGVPTDLADVNSTVSFSFHNTASFFGLHVTSTPFELLYSDLTLATGEMGYFYLGKKSQRKVKVVVAGGRVPLYGNGAQFIIPPPANTPKKKKNQPPPLPPPPPPSVQLNLRFRVRSRAFVLGKLVKPKFYTNVHCLVPLQLTKLIKPISLKNQCQFD